MKEIFRRLAEKAAQAVGSYLAFLVALLTIVMWAVTGPYFNYSDTWQLFINTGTTVVTFLMVFLIQNTQNRETAAVQLKLDELIRAHQGAHNALLDLEELEEVELDRLRTSYEGLAERARTGLDQGLVDTGTPEAGTTNMVRPLSRLVLFDQHGRVMWSAAIGASRRETPS
jgi:low affinity Fe/Cu permease